jgi:small subunit ribosomal protein S8
MTQVFDAIIRIKNAANARRKEVEISYSKMNKSVLTILQKERFLDSVLEKEEDGKKKLVVIISYKERLPIITDCEIISKPSLRKHVGVGELAKQGRKLGVTLISTNKGIMTLRSAVKQKVGGELLFRVW